MPKYDITVKLVGHDSNAFAIIATVRRALRKARVPNEEIKAFLDEAMGGDYNNVLCTCMKWVNVE